MGFFLAMMASCLMFKILTGASKEIIWYQMLFKIGVRYEVLTKSIYKEIFLVFLFPAIVGILHVLVGMNLFSTILAEPYFRVWLPISIFVAIYTIYYYITVQLYKKIVLPKFWRKNLYALYLKNEKSLIGLHTWRSYSMEQWQLIVWLVCILQFSNVKADSIILNEHA